MAAFVILQVGFYTAVYSFKWPASTTDATAKKVTGRMHLNSTTLIFALSVTDAGLATATDPNSASMLLKV